MATLSRYKVGNYIERNKQISLGESPCISERESFTISQALPHFTH